MSHTKRFREHARRHGVSDDAITRILWSVQPSVKMDLTQPEGVRPEDRVVGYVGGLPEMPVHSTWEPGDHFVACLDLAAIPRQPLDDLIPRQGRLLLFASPGYHDTHPDNWLAPVLFVPPGTETAVADAPVAFSYYTMREESQELLERKVLTVLEPAAWDLLGWPESDPQLEAAIEEYGSLVPDAPVMNREAGGSLDLRGTQLNHHDWLAVYEEEFRETRERAVAVVRDAPEKFDELHARALREAAEASGQNTEPYPCFAEVAEANVFGPGDGEVSWMIPHDDLLAQRFDRIEHSYFS
ncbi:hypothetical protein ACWDRM_17680 [Streptomyces cellulosae]